MEQTRQVTFHYHPYYHPSSYTQCEPNVVVCVNGVARAVWLPWCGLETVVPSEVFPAWPSKDRPKERPSLPFTPTEMVEVSRHCVALYYVNAIGESGDYQT